MSASETTTGYDCTCEGNPRCRCIQTPQDKKQMRAALEAAMPAIREQIAQEGTD